MMIPILILISSFLFLFGFFSFNFPTKFLLNLKNPFSTSPVSPLFHNPPSISPPKTPITKPHNLKQVFDMFDKNGDGFITRQELHESLRNIGMIVPAEDVDEVVGKLDSNRDGLIDLGEFEGLFELVKRVGEKEVEIDDEDEDHDLKEAFGVFDGDKDGLITIEELGFVLSSMGFVKKEEDCREMIDKVDVDGDGMVNFDEFKKMMRSGFGGSNLVHAF